MMIDFLSEKPTPKTTKYIIIISAILVIIFAPLVLVIWDLSNYPGTVEITQLGFNASYIKSNLSLMSNDDLSLFFMANILDYIFMLGYGLLLFSVVLKQTRQLQAHSPWQRRGYWISLGGLFSAVCDSLENIFLLIMILNPTSFPTWLAIPHSLFAWFKFILISITLGWIVGMIIAKIRKQNYY